MQTFSELAYVASQNKAVEQIPGIDLNREVKKVLDTNLNSKYLLLSIKIHFIKEISGFRFR